MINETKLSRKTVTAIRKYGLQTCIRAYRENRINGEGASTIVQIVGGTLRTTRQADAAINAANEYLTALGM